MKKESCRDLQKILESLDSVTLGDAYRTVDKRTKSGAMPVEIAVVHLHEIAYLYAIMLKDAELEKQAEDPPEDP